MLKSRAVRFGLALAAAGGLFAATAAPALALDPHANSSAYGLKTVKPILGLLSIPSQANITFPPGGTNNALSVNLGALGGVGVIDTSATGNQSAGSSAATSHIADVALLGALNSAFPGLSANAVEASCSANAPAQPTGATTLVEAHLGQSQVINVSPAPNDVLLNLPGLVKLTLNQQFTDANGSLNVNAIRLQLGTNGALGDLIIAHAQCGPNAPQGPVFNFGETPIILGGIAVLLALVFGIRAGIRRTHAQA
jgi:hypothetical protein